MSRFHALAFTPSVEELQKRAGSRSAYARLAGKTGSGRDPLSEDELEFIARRDSFYMASLSETGWPYVQHRGGPKGFVNAEAHTLRFEDYRGNQQFLTAGNIAKNDRVALIFMDYPNRARLKVLGHARLEGKTFVIDVEGFDWNCPQHITPRYTADELAAFSEVAER